MYLYQNCGALLKFQVTGYLLFYSIKKLDLMNVFSYLHLLERNKVFTQF